MRVLFLTHRLPYTANRGDRIRALNILRALSQYAEVDLLSLVHDRAEEGHAPDLQDLAATVTVARTRPWLGYARALASLPTSRPLTHALLDAPGLLDAVRRVTARHPPDVVLAYCSGMARLALEPPLLSRPCVLDMVDVDSEKWKALGGTAPVPGRWVYASEGRRLAAFERVAARHAHTVLVVNERERSALLALEPGADVRVIPVGVALEDFRPTGPPATGLRVVFCGVMNYAPNADASGWLAREVWPIVRRLQPAATLSLVGAHPTPAVQRLASVAGGIEVTGTVPDVRPYLWGAAVSVAPLLVARGVQNKVLEAIAAGLPCVVTPQVHEGLPHEVFPACEIAGDAASFAQAIAGLLALRPDERRAMAVRADLQSLTWPERLAPLRSILEAASHSAKRRSPSSNGVDGS